MIDNRIENMSAIMDDEMRMDEVSATLKALNEDEALRQRWSRYHLIGDSIRGEAIIPGTLSIADRVHEQLQDEPVLFAPAASKANKPSWHKQWAQYAAGAAIAASVTLMAVLVAPSMISPEHGDAPQVAEVVPQPATAIPTGFMASPQISSGISAEKSYVSDTGTRWNLGQPEVEAKLNSYLLNHKGYAPMSGMQGMLPYATVVSYGSEVKQP